jgi:diaminopimelate epimerase
MILDFSKYQGTGNDFILLDNRNLKYSALTTEQIAFLCDRRFGIGADGLMFLQNKKDYDFEMIYHNADGALGSMCGNGGRCIVMFAHHLGIIKNHTMFLASDGPHEAHLNDSMIELKMKDVFSVLREDHFTQIDTGSPHYIQTVTALSSFDTEGEGRRIRYSATYAKEGINVNFIESAGDGIAVRTYERGVEAETLSCGTGATAAALSVASPEQGSQSVNVQTMGGKLIIKFDRVGENQFENIWLCGPASFVFNGRIQIP